MVDHETVDALLDFATDMPAVVLHACADAISKAESAVAARSSVADIVVTKKRSKILTLLDNCQSVPELHWLAIVLETLSRQAASHASESIHLLWTGKDTVYDSRSLDQALLEVIKSAEKNLWIVCYVSYGADIATGAMKERIENGVRVKMVLEPSIASGGTLNHDSSDWLRKHVPGIELYWWPTERRPESNGIRGALHAKAAVADDDLAVISSANLTGRAMDANLELGVLLRGGDTPRVLRNQLDTMAKRGTFVPLPIH